MSYTTLTAVKAELRADLPTDDTILNAKIAAAQAEIDRRTGRTFEAVTATRYYGEFYDKWVFAENLLLLDADLLTVTTLTNGDGTVITDYWLEPPNQSFYTAIRLKSTVSWAFSPDGRVSVAGTWGRTATAPADIQAICTELAIYLYKLPDTQGGTVLTLPDAGQVAIPIDIPKHIANQLALYRSLVW